MSLTWERYNTANLKSLNIEGQAKIDGSNNVPASNSTHLSETEGKILNELKKHYRGQVKISVDECEKIEAEIDSCKLLTQSNGHTELFADVRTKWSNLRADYELKLSQARQKLENSIDNLSRFRVQNNIIAGREPHIRTNFKLFISILIPIAFAITEIYANVGILAPVTGGSEAIAASMMVSIINIGLSFMVGRMCLTNLFHPVDTSSSKSYYITLVVLFAFVIIYVNFMMGVFRGSNEAALLATDRASMAAASRDALFAAVFPFDDLNTITFSSTFLILVGFFFATFSMLDGYFFDDPINGYGSLGRKFKRASDHHEKLVSQASSLVSDFSTSAFSELDQKRDERRAANQRWGNIMNMLQGDVSEFKNFNDDTSSILLNSIEVYRLKNKTFRTDEAPNYFNESPDTSFIKPFAELHSSISYELKNDAEKIEIMDKNNAVIMREYDDTHAKYTEYFDSERKSLFQLVSPGNA